MVKTQQYKRASKGIVRTKYCFESLLSDIDNNMFYAFQFLSIKTQLLKKTQMLNFHFDFRKEGYRHKRQP